VKANYERLGLPIRSGFALLGMLSFVLLIPPGVAGAANQQAAITVSTSPTSLVVGEEATFSVTVTGSAGTPTGEVTIEDPATDATMCVASLSVGTGTCTASVDPGLSDRNQVIAVYSGDANYVSAVDIANTPTAPASTSIKLTTSSNPGTPLKTIAITAQVLAGPPSQGTPTGTVTFSDSSGPISAGLPCENSVSGPDPSYVQPLVNGVATCDLAFRSAQLQDVWARFFGADGYSAAAAVGLTEIVQPDTQSSYWLVDSAGEIYAHGSGMPYWGAPTGLSTSRRIVGTAGSPFGLGYWMAGADGSVFAFGDAQSFGSVSAIHLNAPIVGMAATPDGGGYWLVGSDGGIFAFGDAHFYGSTGAIHLNEPIVGMATTPDGGGYWLVASDGGIFAFGDAQFYGSTGNLRLNQPVVGMAASLDGAGYWLVAADGGVFSFGDATFYGSTGALRLNKPIVGMAATGDGAGYWFVASDGGVFSFGNAQFAGSSVGHPLAGPVVAMMTPA
jgi:Bacterial Ig-like domain (group 3)